MNQRSAVLLYSAVMAGIAAGFFYALRSERQSKALLREIHDTIEHDAARSHANYRLLKKQRRALRALSDYILPVPKGVEKQPS